MNIELFDRLDNYRKENNYTWFDLAKRIDVHPVTMCRWKNGKISKAYERIIERFLEENKKV